MSRFLNPPMDEPGGEVITLIFSDEFTGTNGTNINLHTPTGLNPQSASWENMRYNNNGVQNPDDATDKTEIQSNALQRWSSTTAKYGAVINTGQSMADTVELVTRVKFQDDATWENLGFSLCENTTLGYRNYLVWWIAGNKKLRMDVAVDGSSTTDVTRSDNTYDLLNDTWYVFKLRLDPDHNFSFYIDGDLKWEFQDTTYQLSIDRYGVIGTMFNSKAVDFDYFYAYTVT